MTCSALRRSYRDILRGAQANVRFLHLSGTEESIGARMAARADHFMPTSLLASQLATLEPLEGDEDGVVIEITGTAEEIMTNAIKALGLRELRAATPRSGSGPRYDSYRQLGASDQPRRDTTQQDPAGWAIASGATDEQVDIVRAQRSQRLHDRSLEEDRTRLELWRHARRSKLQRYAEGVARLVQERLLVRPADQVGIALRRLAENRVERQPGRDSQGNPYRHAQRLAAVPGVHVGHPDAGDLIRC